MNAGMSASEKEQRVRGARIRKARSGKPERAFCFYVFGPGAMTSPPEWLTPQTRSASRQAVPPPAAAYPLPHRYSA